jgi:predicted glycoside hydrolase/deacetylase ChbG (UPF0249 family)
VKHLIINADDLGISPDVNEAVRIGFEAGSISDSSLLVRAPFARDAVAIMHDSGRFRVGVHVDLDTLLGWSSPGRERFSRTTLGAMLETPDFLRRVGREIDSQIAEFCQTGLVPSHVDTHHHVHGFAPIFEVLVEVMDRYEIRALRFCRAGYRLMNRADIMPPSDIVEDMVKTLQDRRIQFPDHFIDPALPFSLTDLSEGVTELMLHPGTEAGSWRERDLHLVMNRQFQTRLREENIGIISFPNLPSIRS